MRMVMLHIEKVSFALRKSGLYSAAYLYYHQA
jgi:hypothetical protein